MSHLPERMVCWPKEWLEAALRSGLAEQTGEGRYRIIGGDEMRDKLQAFASAITDDEE